MPDRRVVSGHQRIGIAGRHHRLALSDPNVLRRTRGHRRTVTICAGIRTRLIGVRSVLRTTVSARTAGRQSVLTNHRVRQVGIRSVFRLTVRGGTAVVRNRTTGTARGVKRRAAARWGIARRHHVRRLITVRRAARRGITSRTAVVVRTSTTRQRRMAADHDRSRATTTTALPPFRTGTGLIEMAAHQCDHGDRGPTITLHAVFPHNVRFRIGVPRTRTTPPAFPPL